MNRRGLEFLENWIHTNVTDADRHGTRKRVISAIIVVDISRG